MSTHPEDPREEDSQEDESGKKESLEDHPLEDDPLENDLFGPDAIEESLSEALNDLEKFLDAKDPAATPVREDAPRDDSAPANVDLDEGADELEQYTIPLLNDVVIPGIGITPRDPAESESESDTHSPVPEQLDQAAMMAQLNGPASGAEAGEISEPELDEAALRRRLADRLASEVEVIVQACLEVAVNNACDEIRVQVRNHLDIILPEIVDDMLQHRQNRNH